MPAQKVQVQGVPSYSAGQLHEASRDRSSIAAGTYPALSSVDEHSSLLYSNINGPKPIVTTGHSMIGQADHHRDELPHGTFSRGVGEDGDDQDDINKQRSSTYLFLLTLGLGGLQTAWCVEISNGSPFLLSLGISKSLLALVWIAGPLTGALVQPYIGVRSDQLRSVFGKRRPFIFGGAIVVVLSLLLLAWSRNVIAGLLSIFDFHSDDSAVKTTIIIFAIIMVYVLDVGINTVQAAIRAFIVDNAPGNQQDAANAWAVRASGVGNIVGYLFGYIDLPKYFWFLGDTQFKGLCAVSSICLSVTVLISCLLVSERSSATEEQSADEKGILASFKSLWKSVRRLPPQTRKVCQVQLAAWIGWFPFLFYTTTYIGQIYVDPIFRQNPDLSPAEVDKIWERGTRVATFAMEIFAVTSFATSVVLPWFIDSSSTIRKPFRTEHDTMSDTLSDTADDSPRNREGAYLYQSTQSDDRSRERTRFKSTTSSLIQRWLYAPLRSCSVVIPGLTLRRTWMLSLLFFALLTWSTLFVHDTTAATILVAMIGIPWAVTNWIPYAIIAAEIRRRNAPPEHAAELEAESDASTAVPESSPSTSPTQEIPISDEERSSNDDEDQSRFNKLPESESLVLSPNVSKADHLQAGVIIGIHNVAIAAPQVLATLASSLIFTALQKPRGAVGDDSVVWVLRFGGLAAVVAGWLARSLGEE